MLPHSVPGQSRRLGKHGVNVVQHILPAKNKSFVQAGKKPIQGAVRAEEEKHITTQHCQPQQTSLMSDIDKNIAIFFFFLQALAKEIYQ